jgi:hypothetical protein
MKLKGDFLTEKSQFLFMPVSQNKNGSNVNSTKIPEQHLDASKQEFLDSHLSISRKMTPL